MPRAQLVLLGALVDSTSGGSVEVPVLLVVGEATGAATGISTGVMVEGFSPEDGTGAISADGSDIVGDLSSSNCLQPDDSSSAAAWGWKAEYCNRPPFRWHWFHIHTLLCQDRTNHGHIKWNLQAVRLLDRLGTNVYNNLIFVAYSRQRNDWRNKKEMLDANERLEIPHAWFITSFIYWMGRETRHLT